MSSKNWFGPRDSVVSLTPPEGFEAVHQEGMTWYKDGINEFETTKKFAYEFNSEIAQLRGLLTVSGIDLSDLPENSPFLLREVILRAIMRILSMQEIDGYGLLDKATYDPQGKETDPFARANHTGTQPIGTISGLPDVLDGMTAALATKAAAATLTNAGLATMSASISDANTAPVGAFAYFSGTDAQAVAGNLPSLNAGGSEAARAWSIITFGRNPGGAADRMAQIALEVFGVGTFKGRTFRREKHGNEWGAWREFATMDRVLALAGGTVTGDLRVDGGLGVGMAPALAGGLYFYRQNGNPFIVFLGDAGGTGTPVQLAQIRAEQGVNLLRLTNAGLSDLVSFNLTTRLATVAGDPTAALGIATKQYVDSKVSTVGLYTGSNVDETAFPVGHIVCAVGGADPDRNAAGDVRIATGTLDYTIGGSGAQLAGTWRARGRTATSNKIMQRVA